MAKIVRADNGMLLFWCPGCQCSHGISDKPGRWTFNGNFESPTIIPSILVRGTKPLTEEQAARLLVGKEIERTQEVCHSTILDGKITFLGDCTHELAGQTIEIPDFESQ